MGYDGLMEIGENLQRQLFNRFRAGRFVSVHIEVSPMGSYYIILSRAVSRAQGWRERGRRMIGLKTRLTKSHRTRLSIGFFRMSAYNPRGAAILLQSFGGKQ